MTMQVYEKILSFWKNEMLQMRENPEFSIMHQKNFTLESYKNYLKETYYHTRENPISQLIAVRSFSRHNHEILSKYVAHARSEISHDLLALNDYVALGGNREEVLCGTPLPDTEAMIGYTYYCAYLDTPLKYLGYLFHVEALPTLQGQDYIKLLTDSGVPENAVTFLKEHADVDPSHSRLMAQYLEALVQTQDDELILKQAIKTGMLLHHRMITGALKKGNA
jgi:pyrroloquinoline quinone (PQQ) biosynthesis protein C